MAAPTSSPRVSTVWMFVGTRHRCAPDPATLDALTSSVDVIIVGELVAVVEGRRAALEAGCTDAAMNEETVPCMGEPLLYRSYVNLVVRPEQVLKETLRSPSEGLHIEVPWPNNLPIDEAVTSAPIGSRVIVLADWVRDAQAEARPLEAMTPGALARVADDLAQVGCLGLAFEEAQSHRVPGLDSDGLVADAFGGTALARLIDASGSVRFDAAVEAIRRTLAM